MVIMMKSTKVRNKESTIFAGNWLFTIDKLTWMGKFYTSPYSINFENYEDFKLATTVNRTHKIRMVSKGRGVGVFIWFMLISGHVFRVGSKSGVVFILIFT